MNPIPLERVSIDDLSYEDFVRRFVMTETPVVLTDVGRTWKAAGTWSVEHFRQNANLDEKVEVQQERLSGSESDFQRLGDVLSIIGDDGRSRDHKMYMNNWIFSRKNEQFRDDYQVPGLFNFDTSDDLGQNFRWIYIGEDGTRGRTHVDVMWSSAWLYLFEGEKQWRFASYDCHDTILGQGVKHSLFDLVPSQLGENSRLFATTQRAGELVWTPSRLVHEVRNSFFTIALTENYVDGTNVVRVLQSLFNDQASPESWRGVVNALQETQYLEDLWAQHRQREPDAWPLVRELVERECQQGICDDVRALVCGSLP